MNYQTAATILLLVPLFVALLILVLHPILRSGSVMLALSSAGLCFVTSLVLLSGGEGQEAGILFPFLNVPGLNGAFGYVLDRQAIGMMFIVTLIGLLVQIYSLAYMKDDDAKPRYFGSLSLFLFSMTGIVLADNFLMMFVFWELVGLSSYLLIGHWFKKPSAADAAKKAFLTNRIGDFGFMIGILCLWGLSAAPAVQLADVKLQAVPPAADAHGTTSHSTLQKPSIETRVDQADFTPTVNFAELRDRFAKGHMGSMPAWLLTLTALGIFLGAVGKSAQVPLHVWLPDAMEGPTPVSALIHAATMVAAGVYMLVRVDFIIEASPTAMTIIAWTGGITALSAALMAVAQNDIKRILAYSTLSQLGYMVMAVGLGAGEAGMFHLYTHAFFKALLFLGAGAVIYACHHEQDIWKMGGLSKKTPATFITFAIGTLALTGMPGLSGFFSKEEILIAAHHECWGLFAIGVGTAFLTAFYMTRSVVVTFFGKARSDHADHAHDAPMAMLIPLFLLTILSVGSAYSLFSDRLLAMKPHGPHGDGATLVMIISIAAFALGTAAGILLYKGKDIDPLSFKILANRFYIDEFYAWTVKIFQDRVAWVVTALDSIFADGLVARLPTAIACRVGKTARSLQSGQLQGYTFILGAGLVLIIYLITTLLPKISH